MEGEEGRGRRKKSDREVCVRKIEKKGERLILPDTYKVKAEGEMHTKRQKEGEESRDSERDSGEKKK